MSLKQSPRRIAADNMEREMEARAYAGVTLLCLTACANDNRPQAINGVVADSPYVAATADMRFVFARPKPSQAASSALGALGKANPPTG